jgi:UDP-N-acetylmuramate dehydrogenase
LRSRLESCWNQSLELNHPEDIADLLEKAGIKVRRSIVLGPYTTWKIGGPADLMVEIPDPQAFSKAISILNDSKVTWRILGRGSNTLVSDKGIRGAVLKLGPWFEAVEINGEEITVGSAFSLIKLAILAGKHGLSGLEWAGGIPGSVGGAICMNAGAHGADVAANLKSAEVVFSDGQTKQMSGPDFQFSYRHSVLQDKPGLVTTAVFKLEVGDPKEITDKMNRLRNYRLETQPLQQPCAGSVFRNPEGDFAARLIQEAGLKGLRHGGAEISALHANFIVNIGGAKASDVVWLIEEAQRKVKEIFGIELVPEVMMVGEI